MAQRLEPDHYYCSVCPGYADIHWLDVQFCCQMKTDWSFDILDALKAPILTHSDMWKDYLPERVMKVVPMARLLYLMQKKEYATEEEAVLFNYTRTHEAPMDRDWAEIYLHLSCTVMERHFGNNNWDDVQAPRELTDYQRKHLLNPLLKRIYEKRRQILKSGLKEVKYDKYEEVVDESELEAAKMVAQTISVPEQLTLF